MIDNLVSQSPSAVRRQEKQQADEIVTRNLCCALDYARSLRTLRRCLASQQVSTSLIRRRDAVFLRVGKMFLSSRVAFPEPFSSNDKH